MKKAKVILTAIAFFALVGGVFASIARQEHNFYREVDGQCNVLTVLESTTTSEGGVETQLSTAPTTDPCPTIRITEAD